MKHLVLALFAFTACGDDGNPLQPPDGGDPDAGTSNHAVVVAGTFTAGEPGVMSVLDLDALTVSQRVAPIGAVGEDPLIREDQGRLYVVNRVGGNNVTILDKEFAVLEQISTGAGMNPQDVAVFGDKLYVPALNSAGVLVLHRGSTDVEVIDLSALDPDGHPDCASAYVVGTDVYVACGLLDDNFQPRGPGKVVVINASVDTVRTMVDLTTNNPFGVFEQMPADQGGHLVIGTVNFGDITQGCVEKITPGVTPVAAGCLVTNTELGGFVSSIRFQNLGSLTVQWMVVATFTTGNLQGYDLVTSDLWPEPITPTTQLVGDVGICPNNKIVVTDTTMAANGLRVYGDDLVERTTAPLAIGLKPTASHGLVCY